MLNIIFFYKFTKIIIVKLKKSIFQKIKIMDEKCENERTADVLVIRLWMKNVKMKGLLMF